MHDMKWSKSEKKLAQQVFDAALEAELAEIVADAKGRATAASDIEDIWALQEHLFHRRRELDQKYDFRYSQLLFVFGRLLREGRIRIEQLDGLSEDKRDVIRRIVSL
jgi:hypothetical protein